MGLRNRLSSLISREDPDPHREMDKLDGSRGEEPPEPNEELAELSGEELAGRLAEMDHLERKDVLKDESFIYHHWRETRESIDVTPALRDKYGLDEQQRAERNGSTVCLNHEHPGPIRQDPYRAKQQRTVGHKHKAKNNRNAGLTAEIDAGNVPGSPVSGTGGINAGTGKGATQEANAQYTEITGPQTMDVCKVDPDNCPTSLKSFYEAARIQYKTVRSEYMDAANSSTRREYISEHFESSTSIHTVDTRTTEAVERNTSADTDATTQTAHESWEHGTSEGTESDGTDETAEEEWEMGEDSSENSYHDNSSSSDINNRL